MSGLHVLGLMAGGLGLFLLGMALMTDGLKLAAGPALHRILASATQTRLHALGSGMTITAMVQSSSAVTVAVIGFVNAGLLALGPALWVLYGANVGTTMTGWIVAVVGLNFKVDALAMPLVGVGAIPRLTAEGRQRGAIGTAVAGFGLLFMGIAVLQQAFAGVAGQIRLPEGDSVLAVLAQLGIGVVLTVLMQSSSAAMAITLTAAQEGLLGMQSAAAVVIGANIGTTVTAGLAALGATANARRAALAHVAFNVLTGTVALLLLPWVVDALGWLAAVAGLVADPATQLALFHTLFNLAGVLLMWPLATRLTGWLQQRFRSRDDDEAQARFLDENILAVPTLALDALEREIARLGKVAVRMVRDVLDGPELAARARDGQIMASLNATIGSFVERMRAASMTRDSSRRLAELLRVQRYYETCGEQAALAAAVPPLVSGGPALHEAHRRLHACARLVLGACDPTLSLPDADDLDQGLRDFDAHYETLKSSLLDAGADGQLPLREMERYLRRYSALRRAVQQAVKARKRLPADQRAGLTSARGS